jgi:hypothetical protein
LNDKVNNRMRILLKRLMWLAAIFLIVWIAVVLYWKSTTRLPSETDLLLYLGVLPLAIAGLAWGGYKLATLESKPATPNQTSGTDKATQDVAKQGAEQEKAWTMNIVAASVQTSAGSMAADVLAKLKKGPIEAELDPELKDEDGFPVFTLRIADLDVSETQDTFAEWLKTSSQPELTWSENQYRALHLASLSLHELTHVLEQHADLVQYLQLQEAGRNQHKADTVVPLRLVLIWPHYWPASHQSAASDWVKDLVVGEGWPDSRIIVQAGKTDTAHPIALIDHITVTSRRGQLPTLGIMLACQSGIDQEYVDALSAKGHLFSGKNSSGSMPGELAAAFIFADDKHAKLLGELPTTALHRASWAARDKSADEARRVTATLLGDLVSMSLESANLDVTKIKHVISDSDHKPSREAELAEMLTAKFPELDSSKDIYKTAQACGTTQHATTVAALCMAHQYVIDEKMSVVCTSLQDAHLRAAVVMSAAAEPNPADADAASKAT